MVDVYQGVPALATLLPVMVPTGCVRQRVHVVFAALREHNIFLRGRASVIRVYLTLRHLSSKGLDRRLVRVVLLAASPSFPRQRGVLVRL